MNMDKNDGDQKKMNTNQSVIQRNTTRGVEIETEDWNL